MIEADISQLVVFGFEQVLMLPIYLSFIFSGAMAAVAGTYTMEEGGHRITSRRLMSILS